ncbi:uncharacterized protein [Triticum aestivum]|nr:uncharacterized protein LOC123168814 isoform X2 [Triticum aestivum]
MSKGMKAMLKLHAVQAAYAAAEEKRCALEEEQFGRLPDRDGSASTFEEKQFGYLVGHCQEYYLTCANITRDLSSIVISIALFDGDKMFFACSGICVSYGSTQFQLTRFETSARLVTAYNENMNKDDNLRIDVRLPSNAMTEGFLGLYDRDIAIVTTAGLPNVRSVELDLQAQAVPTSPGSRILAAGRSFTSAMRGSICMEHPSRWISDDGQHITEAALGGPLISDDGRFLGMNLDNKESEANTVYSFFISRGLLYQRLKHFQILDGIIGATQDVDLVCLRRRGIVRIQVAVLNLNMFKKEDGVGPASVSAGVYVKLNGYNLRFVLEEDDFIPEDDFISRIWEHDDDGPDHGANRDDVLPDQDANKNGKNSERGAAQSNTSSAGTIPMETDNCFVNASDAPSQTDAGADLDVDTTVAAGTGVDQQGDTTSITGNEAILPLDAAAHPGVAACVHAHSGLHAVLPAMVEGAPSVVQPAGAASSALVQPVLGTGAPPAGHVDDPAPVRAQGSKMSPVDASSAPAPVAVVPLGPLADCPSGSAPAPVAIVPVGPAARPSSPTLGTDRSSPILQQPTPTARPKTPMGTMSGGLASPLWRSNRHAVSADGSSSTDEHSLAKAMQRQASRNLDSTPGYFPLYAIASYVVYATTIGAPIAVQGGVYAVAAGGYGGFFPTWVAA